MYSVITVIQPSSSTSTVKMSKPLPKSLPACSRSTMCTAWGSAYCWPLVGTTSCYSSQHIGLPGKTNPSATAVDLAEKTDEESEMEKYTFSLYYASEVVWVILNSQVDLQGGAW